MPPTLEGLKKSRDGYYLNVRIQVKDITDMYENREAGLQDELALQTKLDILARYENTITELNQQIADATDDEDRELEARSAGSFMEKLSAAVTMVKRMLAMHVRVPPAVVRQLLPSPQHGFVPQVAPAPTVRLPKFSLPEYNGDPLAFQEFWDIFETTIHDTNMNGAEKFKYLKMALKGEASTVIAGYRPTADNYSTVIDKLKERFGSKEDAVTAHYRKLHNLADASRDTKSLQTLYDECDKHIRSLIALGVDENQLDHAFAPMLLDKVPYNLRLNMNRENGKQPWTLANFQKLLGDELHARRLADINLKDRKEETWKFSQPQENRQRPSSYYNGPRGFPSRAASASALVHDARPPPNRLRCTYCGQHHYSDECTNVLNLGQRSEMVRRQKLCYQCLRPGHSVRDCRRVKDCFYCRERGHHSSLCPSRYCQSRSAMFSGVQPTQRESRYEDGNRDQVRESVSTVAAGSKLFVHMQMAQVQLQAPNGSSVTARILFDNGSTCSYVTKGLQMKLRLKIDAYQSFSNARFEEVERRVKSYPRVTLNMPCTMTGEVVPLTVFVTDAISCPIRKLPLDVKNHPILKQIQLADPPVQEPEFNDIDILIGGDHYFDLIGSEQIRLTNGPVLLQSKLGYISAGPAVDTSSVENRMHTNFVSSFLSFGSESPVQIGHIDRYWQLEDIGIKDDAVTADDDLAVAQFDKSVPDVNGRLTVSWPYKSESVELPNNRELALARLHYLHKRLSKNPQRLKQYDEVIQDQLDRNIIEPAPAAVELGARVHYLPHHEVIREDRTTTKLRVVYDGSAKKDRKSQSLNECLLRGPVLMSDLCGLLLRFRTHAIGFTADIEKAYLQVGLHAADREVTRFFWLRDATKPIASNNLVVYRFQRVLFGIISSAFLLAATIRYKMLMTSTPASLKVAHDTYVDNFASGTNDVQSATEIFKEVVQLFGEISMNIRAWRSNSTELMHTVSEDKRAKPSDMKVLGLVWDTDRDTLNVPSPKVALMTVVTKRHLMQASAKLYDPCGFFSPVSIRMKLLVQELWYRKIGWDDVLPSDIAQAWDSIKCFVDSLETTRVPRYLGFSVTDSELHVFCDASAKVYAAAVYLRPKDGSTTPQLIFSKARLAPLKKVTIPRLELMAAVVGVRMVSFVEQQLGTKFLRTVLWTDSKCVIYWLASTKVLSVFVENRILEIRKCDAEMRYVPTSQNPADLPTKGTDSETLATSELWWHGPAFLQHGESSWPARPAIDAFKVEKLVDKDDLKADKVDGRAFLEVDRAVERGDGQNESGTSLVMTTETGTKGTEELVGYLGIDMRRFSSLPKLIGATAWVLRFLSKVASKKLNRPVPSLKQQDNVGTGLLQKERHQALVAWILHVQVCLRNGMTPAAFKNICKQLDVFTDEMGILRCGGRMRNSELTSDAKFPILLSKSNRFTSLIIYQCHEDVMHQGPALTQAAVLAKFWIPHGLPRIKSVISKCLWCKHWGGQAFKLPKIAPLPAFRTTRATPFRSVGVDYLGPLVIVSGAKCWIGLFTCSVTRAIHLEVVSDQSTDQFLLAYRRFSSVYGSPTLIVSDNAKYFKLAKDVLHHANPIQAPEWKFIPEFAPWFGGFYERLIGSVKRALRKVLGKSLVDLSTLQTIVAEVIRVINSRPLTVSNDVKDQILTPAHLLGREVSLNSLFDFEVNTDFGYNENLSLKENLLALYAERTAILEQFWQIWHSDYLTSLRVSHRDFASERGAASMEPQLGQAVLIKTGNPRTSWPLAVIEDLQISNDGSVRSAKMRTFKGGHIVRPLSLIVPLETEDCEIRATANRSDNSAPPTHGYTTDSTTRKSARTKQIKEKQDRANLSSEDEC